MPSGSTTKATTVDGSWCLLIMDSRFWHLLVHLWTACYGCVNIDIVDIMHSASYNTLCIYSCGTPKHYKIFPRNIIILGTQYSVLVPFSPWIYTSWYDTAMRYIDNGNILIILENGNSLCRSSIIHIAYEKKTQITQIFFWSIWGALPLFMRSFHISKWCRINKYSH